MWKRTISEKRLEINLIFTCISWILVAVSLCLCIEFSKAVLIILMNLFSMLFISYIVVGLQAENARSPLTFEEDAK